MASLVTLPVVSGDIEILCEEEMALGAVPLPLASVTHSFYFFLN